MSETRSIPEQKKKPTAVQRYKRLFSRVFLSSSLLLTAPTAVMAQQEQPATHQDKESQQFDMSDYRLPFDGMFRITQGRSAFTIDGQPCTVQFHTTHQNLAKESIDFLVPEGTALRAVQAGEVIFTGWINQYGNAVRIQHTDGLVSWYGHLSEVAVQKGDTVRKGSYLGKSGKSGTSAAHLHLEIRDETNNSVPITINGLQYMGGFDESCSYTERFEGYGEHKPVFEVRDIPEVKSDLP